MCNLPFESTNFQWNITWYSVLGRSSYFGFRLTENFIKAYSVRHQSHLIWGSKIFRMLFFSFNVLTFYWYLGTGTTFCPYLLVIYSECREYLIQLKASATNRVSTSACNTTGLIFLYPHTGWNLDPFQKGLGLIHSFI